MQIDVTGSGRTADEYIIHQVEMVVKKLGIGACAVCAEKLGYRTLFKIRYGDGRFATMTYAPRTLPFTVFMSGGEQRPVWAAVDSDFFKSLMADIIRFFDEGTVSFDVAETMEAMRVREAALKAMDTLGTWVSI